MGQDTRKALFYLPKRPADRQNIARFIVAKHTADQTSIVIDSGNYILRGKRAITRRNTHDLVALALEHLHRLSDRGMLDGGRDNALLSFAERVSCSKNRSVVRLGGARREKDLVFAHPKRSCNALARRRNDLRSVQPKLMQRGRIAKILYCIARGVSSAGQRLSCRGVIKIDHKNIS